MRLNGRLNRLSSVLFRYDAPIVKWYNTSMVRRRSKFDSWWEHHLKLPNVAHARNLVLLVILVFLVKQTNGGLVKWDHVSMAWISHEFDSRILHQVVPSSIG